MTNMNYPTKVQAIRRKKAASQCYVNLPLPLAAAIDIEPGENRGMEGGLPLQTLAHPPTTKEETKIVGGFSAESRNKT